MNPGVVPMISPDGSSGDVPYARVNDATAAGFKPAVVMTSPDGQMGYVPRERAADALKAGFKVGQPQTQFEKDRAPAVEEAQTVRNPWAEVGHIIPGAASAAVGEVAHLVKSVPGALASALESGGGPVGVSNAAQMADKIASEDAQRKASARSVPYRVAAGVGTAAGVNAKGMEDAADVGDTSKVLGIAAGDAAPLVAAELVKGKVEGLRTAAQERFKAVQGKSVQATVMPEAANLPPKAVSGAEDVFRAAAPTGMNKGFRANVYAAAGDLADISRKADIAEAKGGIVNPDMRVRATVDAIRNHLDEMYQTERSPQVQRHADTPLEVGTNANSRNGLEYIQKTAGDVADAQIAQKALDNKQLTVQEADRLSILANKTLTTFERATPEVKMQLQMTNPKVGGLKALDTELGQNLNDTLMEAGEPGLRSYERRYAALSAIRDQLESRMNAVELKHEGVVGAVGRMTRPLVKLATEGPSGVPSASQAAVADVNIGRTLQTGLRKLKESGVTAQSRR